ncbi:MAG TPA: type II toxin-antitoxin system RelE/ParE family toxin [Terracidiphilus sp.]
MTTTETDKQWAVDFDQEFAIEVRGFSKVVQDSLFALLIKLRHFGPQLGRPDVDTLNGSQYPNMKELRFNVSAEVWRVAFAFDPKRKAILLIGGSKSGVSQKRFYKGLIRLADERFERHLATIAEERKKK